METRSAALQANSLPAGPPGKPKTYVIPFPCYSRWIRTTFTMSQRASDFNIFCLDSKPIHSALQQTYIPYLAHAMSFLPVFKAERKSTQHHIHHFKVYNSVVFLMFLTCNRHYHTITFTSKENKHPIVVTPNNFPPPRLNNYSSAFCL